MQSCLKLQYYKMLELGYSCYYPRIYLHTLNEYTKNNLISRRVSLWAKIWTLDLKMKSMSAKHLAVTSVVCALRHRWWWWWWWWWWLPWPIGIWQGCCMNRILNMSTFKLRLKFWLQLNQNENHWHFTGTENFVHGSLMQGTKMLKKRNLNNN